MFPGNPEVCDSLDNNCDGTVDEGLSTDADADGHYTAASCYLPNDDCDDTNGAVHPDARELCNELDDDCDGLVDDDDPSLSDPGAEWAGYVDGDGDGWGAWRDGVCDERRLIARAFVAAAGLQCGFCIPGIALRTKHLLDRQPAPSRAAIARALDTHLCRCTGYTRIIDAVELAARARRGEPIPDPGTDGRVGRSLARYRGEALVLSAMVVLLRQPAWRFFTDP